MGKYEHLASLVKIIALLKVKRQQSYQKKLIEKYEIQSIDEEALEGCRIFDHNIDKDNEKVI